MRESHQGDVMANEIKNRLKTPITGIDELETWLTQVLKSASEATDPHTSDLYQFFKLGNAESIIRIHATNNLLQTKIWFYGLLGRPAPEIIKNKITSVLETIFNVHFTTDHPAPFFDLYEKAKPMIIANTFIINNELPPLDRELHAIKKLMQEPIELADITHERETQLKTTNKPGLFQPSKPPQPLTKDDAHEAKQKIPLK